MARTRRSAQAASDAASAGPSQPSPSNQDDTGAASASALGNPRGGGRGRGRGTVRGRGRGRGGANTEPRPAPTTSGSSKGKGKAKKKGKQRATDEDEDEEMDDAEEEPIEVEKKKSTTKGGKRKRKMLAEEEDEEEQDTSTSKPAKRKRLVLTQEDEAEKDKGKSKSGNRKRKVLDVGEDKDEEPEEEEDAVARRKHTRVEEQTGEEQIEDEVLAEPAGAGIGDDSDYDDADVDAEGETDEEYEAQQAALSNAGRAGTASKATPARKVKGKKQATKGCGEQNKPKSKPKPEKVGQKLGNEINSEKKDRCNPCKEAGTPCNWKEKNPGAEGAASVRVFLKECSACAERRAHDLTLNPFSCRVTGSLFKRVPDYADNVPKDLPTEGVCERCQKTNSSHLCDADVALGLGCSLCHGKQKGNPNATQKGKQKDKQKIDPCIVDGVEMNARPFMYKGNKIWWRTGCGNCKDKRQPCSWNVRRDLKDKGQCERCLAEKIYCHNNDCFDDIKGNPPLERPDRIPNSWYVAKDRDRGGLERAGETKIGPTCLSCYYFQDPHCRAMADHPRSACTHCAATGVPCRVMEDGVVVEFPLYNLSHVGVGLHAPFVKCKNCREKGRNCDRQRPCDSCVDHDEDSKCDKLPKKKQTKNRPAGGGDDANEKENDGQDGNDEGGEDEDGNDEGGNDGDGEDGEDGESGQVPQEAAGSKKPSKRNLFPRGFERPGWDPVKNRKDRANALYYLAMGYGPGGVNDVRDDAEPYAWIGPLRPVCAINTASGLNRIMSQMTAVRNEMLPDGIPPHTGPDGLMRDRQYYPSNLTAARLNQLLSENGVTPTAPRDHENYDATVSRYDSILAERFRVAKVAPRPPRTDIWQRPVVMWTPADFTADGLYKGREVKQRPWGAAVPQNPIDVRHRYIRDREPQFNAQLLAEDEVDHDPGPEFLGVTLKRLRGNWTTRYPLSRSNKYRSKILPVLDSERECQEPPGVYDKSSCNAFREDGEKCNGETVECCRSSYHTEKYGMCADCISKSKRIYKDDSAVAKHMENSRMHLCTAHTAQLFLGRGQNHESPFAKSQAEQNCSTMRELGVQHIYNGTEKTLLVWPPKRWHRKGGCPCESSISDGVLCKFHRLLTFEAAQTDVERIRGNLNNTLNFDSDHYCPWCMKDASLSNGIPYSSKNTDFPAWICMGCSSLVLRQKNFTPPHRSLEAPSSEPDESEVQNPGSGTEGFEFNQDDTGPSYDDGDVFLPDVFSSAPGAQMEADNPNAGQYLSTVTAPPTRLQPATTANVSRVVSNTSDDNLGWASRFPGSDASPPPYLAPPSNNPSASGNDTYVVVTNPPSSSHRKTLADDIHQRFTPNQQNQRATDLEDQLILRFFSTKPQGTVRFKLSEYFDWRKVQPERSWSLNRDARSGVASVAHQNPTTHAREPSRLSQFPQPSQQSQQRINKIRPPLSQPSQHRVKKTRPSPRHLRRGGPTLSQEEEVTTDPERGQYRGNNNDFAIGSSTGIHNPASSFTIAPTLLQHGYSTSNTAYTSTGLVDSTPDLAQTDYFSRTSQQHNQPTPFPFTSKNKNPGNLTLPVMGQNMDNNTQSAPSATTTKTGSDKEMFSEFTTLNDDERDAERNSPPYYWEV